MDIQTLEKKHTTKVQFVIAIIALEKHFFPNAK